MIVTGDELEKCKTRSLSTTFQALAIHTSHKISGTSTRDFECSASDFNTFVYMPSPPFQASHSTLVELFATFALH